MNTVNSIMLIDDDAATNFYHKIIIQRLNCCKRIEIFDDKKVYALGAPLAVRRETA